MNYKRFEDLPVWQESVRFSVDVYDFTYRSNGLFTNLGDLKRQIERTSLAISNNIAAGFERECETELLQFLYVARSACGECRSITHILSGVPSFRSKRCQIEDLRNSAETISRHLGGWIQSLKSPGRSGEWAG